MNESVDCSRQYISWGEIKRNRQRLHADLKRVLLNKPQQEMFLIVQSKPDWQSVGDNAERPDYQND